MFRIKSVEKITTYNLCIKICFCPVVPFVRICGKIWCSQIGFRLQYNRVKSMGFGVLYNQGKNTDTHL